MTPGRFRMSGVLGMSLASHASEQGPGLGPGLGSAQGPGLGSAQGPGLGPGLGFQNRIGGGGVISHPLSGPSQQQQQQSQSHLLSPHPIAKENQSHRANLPPVPPSGQRRILPTSSSSSSSNGIKTSSSASASGGGSTSAPALGLEGGGGPSDVDAPTAHTLAVKRTSALLIVFARAHQLLQAYRCRECIALLHR